MDLDRRRLLWSRVVEFAGSSHGPPSANAVCSASLPILDADSASVTIFDDSGFQALLGCSDQRSQELVELESTLGQGPCRERFETGAAVLIADLGADGSAWPAYAAEALRQRVRALFAIPVGPDAVMALYRDTPGMITNRQLADTHLLVSAAAELPAHDMTALDWPEAKRPRDRHAKIYTASRAVAEQLGLQPDQALSLLREYATTHDRALYDVANEVLFGFLQLGSDQ